jgi:signal transduction histidine kinase
MPQRVSLQDETWRVLVESLDEGVIVFDQRGVVIYANQEAGRLLGYAHRDVLELTRDDLLSLFQKDRLEEPHLARAILGQTASLDKRRAYEVTTLSRRLLVTPFVADAEAGLTAVLVRELRSWRAELIADALADEMRSPLAFAASYCETLLRRMGEEWPGAFELHDLARIIRDSIGRAIGQLESLTRLRDTDPRFSAQEFRPISFKAAAQRARRELEMHSVQGIHALRFDLPDDLPPVRTSEAHLHAALCALIEGATQRLGHDDRMLMRATNRDTYVQIDLVPSAPGAALRGYLFDALPFAIAEQVIVQQGGSLWITTRPGRPAIFSFSLPVWAEGGPAAQTE